MGITHHSSNLRGLNQGDKCNDVSFTLYSLSGHNKKHDGILYRLIETELILFFPM